MMRFRWILLPVVTVPVTLVLLIPMLLVALFKLAVPAPPVQRACRRIVVAIAEAWLELLVGMFRATLDTRIEVTGEIDTDRRHSYLLLCNHASWADVPVLLWMFRGRLPFYRFFLKRSLIWMPLLGPAFWALEYPFVRFPSRETLERYPDRRGENLRTARKACRHIRGQPTTVVNFPEGAIFTREKHAEQKARYHHLLRPRAGGTALVVAAMGDQLDSLVDVTLHFPGGPPGLLAFMTNRVDRVQAHVRRIAIPADLARGDYENDPEFRRRFQDWLNAIWHEKDRRLERLHDAGIDGMPPPGG